jgi:S1-C subfamily serine protease
VVGGTPPGNVQATPLDGASLYKLLKVSIFQLEATRKDGVSQGSAVAVSPTELLTNCHVVQGSRSLVVRQDHVQWNGRIDRADPKTDRCIVVVPNGSFTPIAGVRPYESLEVGESVYTLGSPIGLELTLANGILSGRREEGGRRYVQTTAPISPGSSGGGLFDARGNLIGITTLAIVGKERLNQALNFAIPADAFWK